MMRSAQDYSSATFADVLVYADQYVGLPYVWGGKDLYRDGGFDCSGFVNWVYNHVCGMNINSDYTSAASLYYNYCTPISEKDARPGDIVFWKGTYGSLGYISHVGIYCGNGVTIDAGDPIGYDRVTDIKNMNGKTAERVYGRLVSLSDTSIRLDSAIVKARVSDRAYTGSAQEPRPTVVAAGSVLREGTDYTLSYSNNVNVGTASVTIKGKGNYRGSVTKNFKIYKDTFKAGTYMASSALRSNFVMDVADGSTGAGAGIQLYSSNGTDAQRFKIQKTSDGYYTIQNSKSDLYLTLYTTWADLKNGQQVTQRSYTGGMSQKWCMEQNSDGTYTVVSAMDSSMAIDVANGNAFNGAVVQAWGSNGTAAQRWMFDAVAKGGAAKTVSYPYSLSYIANLNQVSAKTLNPNAVSSNSNAYYQFMDCRGYTGQVSASQMNRIIDNTEKGRQGVFHGRGQAIIDAAKAANINEMYLMAHMVIETGWGTSAQANGKYFAKGNATIKSDGKTYTKNCPAGTYYNFIGWGAYDSNPNTAYDYARYYGWNSVDAALKGAAEKLAKFYLYNGQETVYEMRWNPDAASLGKTHQYCTSTNWAESIGITIGYNYRLIGVTPKASFIVPKYL